jgi:hypothetical protein
MATPIGVSSLSFISAEDAFLKIDVESCVEDMITKIEEDAERTPRRVERRLFEDNEDEEEGEPSITTDPEVLEELRRVGERMWEEWDHSHEDGTGVDEGDEGICESCGLCHWQIGERCTNTYGFSIDYLVMTESGGIICQSCMCEGIKCIECGVSEKLTRTICDRDAEFKREDETFPPVHRCEECHEQHEIYLATRLGREEITSETDEEEILETYNGEFEIDTEGDESLLEDDEETKTTKDMMKEVMDEMFEVSSDIPENTYMNIVNKMKQVYDRL